MIKPEREINKKAYEVEHIKEVLSEITINFTKYFSLFKRQESLVQIESATSDYVTIIIDSPNRSNERKTLREIFEYPLDKFLEEQPDYQSLFDLEILEEYEDDPNAFKKDLTKSCPIIRRCINSPAREMKKYKNAFRLKSGRELLSVTRNIIDFGNHYMEEFDSIGHEKISSVEGLNLSELLTDDYISYEVIGGGIKSNFLYSLFPTAFPNRSQSAIWALWYLSGQRKFGFKDDSEFIMIDIDNGSTQQNYHYPYDLFGFYALNIYRMLKEVCEKEGMLLEDRYRYIYLDTFLNYISNFNQEEIDELKSSGNYEE